MSILKVVIAGSRTIKSEAAYAKFLTHMAESLTKHANSTLARQSGYQSLVIISGGAEGVDQFAKRYAKENAYLYREFKPLYRHKGDDRAPLRRNVDMAKLGDILIAVWNGRSPGTKHMINTIKKKPYTKPVYLLELRQ